MPRLPVNYLEELAAEWEPRLRAAFFEAVADIANRVDIRNLVTLLEKGDVEGAIRAVGLDPTDFRLLDMQIGQTFNAGGIAAAGGIPPVRMPEGHSLLFRFDIRNLRGEQWARQRSSTLITEIVEDQRDLVRTHLSEGLARGLNPRTVSLDLVGRIPVGRNERTGGVIGVTSQQERWVAAYLDELKSGDPAALRNALKRGLRDRRFDRTILKAIREEKPVPAEIVAKMRSTYARRVLKYRGDVIARNETIRALGAAQTEAYQQAIDKGAVEVKAVTRSWRTAMDERVRHDHRMIPGMNAEGRGWNEPFETPTGPSMHAPHDTDIMCRCHEQVSVDFMRGLR